MSERYPVIGSRHTIPLETVDRAYGRYLSIYGQHGGDLHLLDYFLGRGGFTTRELDKWAPGWREMDGPLRPSWW